MIPAGRAPFLPIAGPPGPPESALANLASSLRFPERVPAPFAGETGATDRGRGRAT
jgi:hypothetical protein